MPVAQLSEVALAYEIEGNEAEALLMLMESRQLIQWPVDSGKPC